jgi:hypothetical protein
MYPLPPAHMSLIRKDSGEIIDNERPGAGPCDLLLVSVRVLIDAY